MAIIFWMALCTCHIKVDAPICYFNMYLLISRIHDRNFIGMEIFFLYSIFFLSICIMCIHCSHTNCIFHILIEMYHSTKLERTRISQNCIGLLRPHRQHWNMSHSIILLLISHILLQFHSFKKSLCLIFHILEKSSPQVTGVFSCLRQIWEKGY